jgi:hypothetical protein
VQTQHINTLKNFRALFKLQQGTLSNDKRGKEIVQRITDASQEMAEDLNKHVEHKMCLKPKSPRILVGPATVQAVDSDSSITIIANSFGANIALMDDQAISKSS